MYCVLKILMMEPIRMIVPTMRQYVVFECSADTKSNLKKFFEEEDLF